jgi:hypothetical protein
MKHWLRLALFLLLLVPAGAQKHNLLLRLNSEGGFTPKGVGFAEIRVENKGAFRMYNKMRDERVGPNAKPDGANGWKIVQLKPAELAELKRAVQLSKFDAVQLDASRTAPSAADGADRTLIVGRHRVPLWQVTNPEVLPVVPVLDKLRARYDK